jgi:FAD/FMN-containing dehydrogenase
MEGCRISANEAVTSPNHLLRKLEQELGEGSVLAGPSISGGFLEDWPREKIGQCLAVVRPTTVQDVSRIVSLCCGSGVGIVPQGGHTGLVGGAQRQHPDCIVLSLSLLSSIREVDRDNMTAIVEGGVVLQHLQTALSEYDLEFPVSIGAQGTAQIGGLISTNAGGVQVVRHGMTGAHVQGLELVLADGQIVSSMSGLYKDNRGPDPLRIAVGGEGAFGIVTAACLRLTPRPSNTATAYVGCVDFDAALALFRNIRAEAYEFLTGFEVMSAACLPLAHLVDPDLTPPFEAPVHVLVRLGAVAKLPLEEMLETLLTGAMEKRLAQDAVLAQSEGQAARLWALREGLVEGHSKRGYHVRSDVSVRLGDVPCLVARLEAMLAEEFPAWISQAYGHMGDGNIHFNALPPLDMPDQTARDIGSQIEARIFDITLGLKGSYSAEHGIGRTKAGWFARTTPANHIDLLGRIKTAFDPGWRMNPDCLLAEEKEQS